MLLHEDPPVAILVRPINFVVTEVLVNGRFSVIASLV
jgi:hypothetical protein